MSSALFWIALTLILYAYAGFPLLLWLRARLWPRPYHAAEIRPAVSVIIAAYNEERTIGAKLENLLSLDYPPELLEVIVASDGSEDGTNAIVAGFAARGVRLLPLARQGKAGALNAAVAEARGEVLVFSDANSMLAQGALRALVRPFADSEIGGVAGNQCYERSTSMAASSTGEHSYWNLDRRIKHWQSEAGSATSATGSLYAIRRRLFLPVPEGVTDDFITSTAVIIQGYRLVFAAGAVAFEPVATSAGIEFGRKVRIMTRGYRAVLLRRQLLNPLRYGFYALQLLSHKILRRCVVLPLLALLAVSPWVWYGGALYQAGVVAQLALYGFALLGVLLGRTRLGRAKLLALPLFVCLVNAASLVALFNLLRGHKVVLWQPQRSAAAA